jgi:hypothetical protein
MEMDRNSADLNWSEDQWNRVLRVVSEEAQRARLGASFLPVVSWPDPYAEAIPPLNLYVDDLPAPLGAAPAANPPQRMWADSDPTLNVTTFSGLVYLRSTDVADPDLGVALAMFRRVANAIARAEDALIFRGQDGAGNLPPGVQPAFANFITTSGGGVSQGLLPHPSAPFPPNPGWQVLAGDRQLQPAPLNALVQSIADAVGTLEGAGYPAPHACVLGPALFTEAATPLVNTLVMPRDRILPLVDGRLFRSSVIPDPYGLVVSLSGSSMELVVVADISVRFLQINSEPRYVFRVSERVAMRLREPPAVVVLWR